MNCIHQEAGLCPECQEDYDADPEAWHEFGQHPQGIENWKRLQAEMEAARLELEQEANTTATEELPF